MQTRLAANPLKVSLAACVASLWLAACGAAGVSPEMLTRAQSHDSSATEATITHGKTVYEAKCGTCHALPLPSAHSAEEWPEWVKKMAPQAKLSADDEEAVLHYVLAASDG